MSTRERTLAGIAVLVFLVVALGAWWLFFREPEDSGPSAGPAEDELELEQWGVAEPSRRSRASSEESAAPPDVEDPERTARRERWRERWRRAVDIVPLGPAAPGIEPDQIREALAPGREALRDCIREQGGWRALREARRAERAEGAASSGVGGSEPTDEAPSDGRRGRRGRRERRRVSFDVRADGTVEADTVDMVPPIPPAFDPCFRTFFSSAEFSSAGADGARIEMPMGPPGGRRRRGGVGDGGVGRRRGGWGADGPRQRRGAQREETGGAPSAEGAEREPRPERGHTSGDEGQRREGANGR